MIFEQDWQVRIQEVNTKLDMKFTGILEAFQEAATIHFEEIGYGIKKRTSDSPAVIILNSKVNIIKKPKWNDTFTVRTWCNELNRIYCYRNFEIIDSKGNIIATGMNKLVLMDLSKRRIMRIDEKIKNDIELEDKFLYDNEIKEIEIPNTLGKEEIQIIRNRDIDINGHVNNVAFVEIALNALSREQYKKLDKMNLEVHYKKECKNQDTLKTVLYEENNEYTIVLKSSESDTIYSIVKVY